MNFIERYEKYLPQASGHVAVAAPASGYVAAWDTRALGLVVVNQGGGRVDAGQSIDHSVGLSEIVRVGHHVEAGQPLAILHGSDNSMDDRIQAMVLNAVTLADEPMEPLPAVHERVGK